MRVEPPTRTASLICCGVTLASFRAFLQGSMVRWKMEPARFSYWARVSFIWRCLGPEASAVMKGRLISVSRVWESSILARSQASLRRWRAMGSC